MMEKEKKRPLILVSNDDGYDFNGIKTLVSVAKKFGEVVVAAPATHQSGKGCSLTLINPVRAAGGECVDGVKQYVVTGTPTDCVKLALNQLLDGRTPDLVISGINHGYNTGASVFNSGTIGAALEGSIHGIDSIAFSFGNYSFTGNFDVCIPWVEKVIERVLEKGLPKYVFLNVNIPFTTQPIVGFHTATNGLGHWAKEYEMRTDPFGHDYYWMTGQYQLDEPNDPTADTVLLSQGYVTVAPCRADICDRTMMEQITSLLS